MLYRYLTRGPVLVDHQYTDYLLSTDQFPNKIISLIKYSSVDLLRKYLSLKQETINPSATIQEIATKKGDLEMLKYFLDQDHHIYISVLYWAAEVANLEIITWYFDHYHPPTLSPIVSPGLRSSNPSLIIDWLISVGYQFNYSNYSELAEHPAVFKYLMERTNWPLNGITYLVIDNLIERNQNQLIKELFDRGYKHSDISNFETAARVGNLETIKLLFEHRPRALKVDHSVLDQAIEHNHHQIIELLLEKECPYNQYSVTKAVGANNLPLLKRFYQLTPVYFRSKDNTELAARLGHREIFFWLIEINCEVPTSFNSVAVSGDLKIVEYLAQSGVEVDNEMILLAAQYGHQGLIEWSLKHGSYLRFTIINNAIVHRQNHLIQWLIDQGCPLEPSLIFTTIKFSNLPALEILARYIELKSDHFLTAINDHRMEVIDLLDKLHCPFPNYQIEIRIWSRKEKGMIRWLVEHGYDQFKVMRMFSFKK